MKKNPEAGSSHIRQQENTWRYCRLRLMPCPEDVVIDTDSKSIREAAKEMKMPINAVSE